MPYITRVLVENCRNVRRLEVDLTTPPPVAIDGAKPLPARHLILTGPNGSGKTGVFETLSQTLQGADAARVKRRGTILEFDAPLSRAIKLGRACWFALEARRTLELVPVQGPTKQTLGVESLTQQARSHLFTQYLVNQKTQQAFAQVDGDQEAVDRLERWFAALENNLRHLFEDPELTLRFERNSFTFTIIRGDGYQFDITQLSAGHGAVLAVLAECLLRVEAARRITNDASFMPEGVVLIDEIETHLHLRLQELILPFLTRTFPTFQYIVTTHSPAVIASIPNATVYDLALNEAVPSESLQGKRYGDLMRAYFMLPADVDRDSSKKLARLRALTAMPSPSAEEQSERAGLAQELSARSAALALEVWLAQQPHDEADAATEAEA